MTVAQQNALTHNVINAVAKSIEIVGGFGMSRVDPRGTEGRMKLVGRYCRCRNDLR